MKRQPLAYSIPWESQGSYCIQGPFTKAEAEVRLDEMKKIRHNCANLVSDSTIPRLVNILESYLSDKAEVAIPTKEIERMLRMISKEV